MQRDDFEFSVLCPAGFEGALGDELRALKCRRVRPLRGSVAFFGSLRDAYRVCLWSRLASRVILVVDRVDCTTVEGFYDACSRGVAWEDHIGRGATIAVEARGGNASIRDMRYTTLRVKDAICDRLRDVWGERPSVDADEPDVRVSCMVRERKATLGIDLGGSSLVDHGYRVPARGKAAPGHASFVREDMAALVLALGGWGKICGRSERANLVDPLGSSAALALEAACIACDRAPRLARRHWGFAGWAGHDAAAWAEELSAAQARFDRGRAAARRVVVACTDEGVRAEIAEMARRCGVAGALDVQACGPFALDLGEEHLPNALVACAVPDGPRDFAGDLPARLVSLAALTRTEPLAEAPVVALAATDAMEYALGLEPDATCHVINGRDDVDVHVFPSAAQAARRGIVRAETPLPPSCVEGAAAVERAASSDPAPCVELPGGRSVSVLVPTSDQFAARLGKVAKQRAKWAARAGVACYRVYDADLPDYAVAVDLYEGGASTPGRWVVVAEYAAPREIDARLAARRLSDVLAIVPAVLDVDPENVFLKVRRRAKGGSQYAERASHGRTALVEEGGLVFEVNFSDRLDTGLFLDHRIVRSMIRDMAPRTRFLNLFAYTGTATCYAADGGAYQTTTVDLSNTYLAWARRNMEQNGFSGPAHEYVQADVVAWVSEQRRTANRWDLIYVDPPTFSNSARMKGRGFDVQGDHVELLMGASRLLARGGTIVFSCNLRGFKLDRDELERLGLEIEDVTPASIPEDFARNAKIHHCYLVRRAR